MHPFSLLRRAGKTPAAPSFVSILLAGIGGGLAITLLALLQSWSSLTMLLPAFGASCALVFAVPQSPFSRPVSVIGGHLVASACGLIVLASIGTGPLALGVGVGFAIAAMLATRTLHPPAGGDPLVVILTAATPGFLVEPILLGTVAIVLTGAAYHRLVRTA